MRGLIYGKDNHECIYQLRIRQLYPLKVKPVFWGKEGLFRLKKVLSYAELGIFCKQFSVILQAGISIPQALKLMSLQKTSPNLQRIIPELLESLKEGETLYSGFNRYTAILPPFFCALVKAGELTNSLVEVFEQLSHYYEEEDDFKREAGQLMVYPTILMISTLMVVIFLFLKIIPDFQEIYQGFDQTLPMLTYCLLAISQHLTINLYKYLIGFLLGIISLSMVFRSPKMKIRFALFLYRLPYLGLVKKKMLIAKLARTLSLLLSNGLEVLPALELMTGTTGFVADQCLRQIASNLREGVTFAQCLRLTCFFPDLFLEMVSIGEESGALCSMLVRVADIYEKDVKDRINRMLTILEPALLIGVALIVGVIVLAIMLPMFELLKVF